GCAFEEFVRLVQGASRVYTDRLHTMVLACLLGKPVTAYELRRPKLGPFFDLAMSDWGDVTFVTVQR
ncbi:MAG: polysaccharide pyruvyl transferase family protein, partial [Candidatus Riflebacteria bacterium]|nr:polysaccharide pyruvyl transferase family protein [Candidatus Riflebacteria bacterium]